MYELNNAPATSHRSSDKFLANPVESPSSVGLPFEVSSFDPCMYFTFRKSGRPLGWSPDKLTTFRVAANPIHTRRRGLSGGAFWEIEGPGKALCARRHGTGPGEGFLCDVDPGGLYEEPEVITNLPRVVGRTEKPLVDGLRQIAPAQVERIALGRHGFPTR